MSHAALIVACVFCQTDAQALAVVSAMEIHEQSVRTLRWHQRVLISTPGEPEFVLSESRQASDSSTGAWMCDATWAAQNDNGEWQRHRSMYATPDGVTYLGRAEAGPGIIRPSDGERHLYRSPEHLMGRWIDRTGEATLWEAMRAGDSLRVEAHEGAVWRLSCVAEVAGTLVDVRVAADQSLGFALTELEMRDVLSGVPYDRRRATRFEVHDGLNVPVEGDFSNWAAEMNPEQIAALNSELSLRGIAGKGDPRDPEFRRNTREAVRAVFGDAGVPRKMIGVGIMTLRCDSIEANAPIAEAEFMGSFADGPPMFNAYTGGTAPLREHGMDSRPLERSAFQAGGS